MCTFIWKNNLPTAFCSEYPPCFMLKTFSRESICINILIWFVIEKLGGHGLNGINGEEETEK